jgi:hypothetical protein
MAFLGLRQAAEPEDIHKPLESFRLRLRGGGLVLKAVVD